MRIGKEKEIIYLIQGQANMVNKFSHLASRTKADSILMTYDEPLEGAVFFPNSTWSEGRNELLRLAEKSENYEFYVFCDDDVEFLRGDWDMFENALLKYNPSIAVPVVPKTKKMTLPLLKYQTFRINDEQMIAFHREVVAQRIILPYQSSFDKIHWWAACEIQEILIQNFYRLNSFQINTVEISNLGKTRYWEKDPEDVSYKKAVRKWLEAEFTDTFRLTSKNFMMALPEFLKEVWNERNHVTGNKTRQHSISEELLRTRLSESSTILERSIRSRREHEFEKNAFDL